MHPTERRWKRRRKQQTFLPSPHRKISPVEEVALKKQLGYVPPNICCVSARSSNRSRLSTDTNSLNEEIDISSSGINRPIAIQSYPLLIQKNGENISDESKFVTSMYDECKLTPFPTMYWLCDIHISRAISELERQGFVRLFQTRLESNVTLVNEWLECHELYAMERWDLLSDLDKEWLSRDDITQAKEQKTIDSMKEMIRYSGVAGTDYNGQKQHVLDVSFVPSVKCLHSHYAHYRSKICSKGDDRNLNVVGVWTHELLLEKFPDIVL